MKTAASPTKKRATTQNNQQSSTKPSCAAAMASLNNNHARLAQRKALWNAQTQRILEAERRLEEEETETEGSDAEERLDPSIQQQIHETEKHHLSDNCRRDCRHRIKRMIKFWKQSNKVSNSHVQRAVRKVPLDEHNNKSNWCCANRPGVGPFKEDLCCDEMSADHCKHFITEIMIKEDGNYRSADDVRKFRDAIMWGAKTSKQFTPSAFCGDIETFHKVH